jgi:hypothetical protein
MNLDSVRELKSSLLENVLPDLSTTVRTRSLPGEAVRALGVTPKHPPTLALGVARRTTGDFALAIRVQPRAIEQSRAVEP